jgi:hypothetical protein
VRVPVGIGQLSGRVEDGDHPTFVAIAAPVMAVGRAERRGCRDDLPDLLVQAGLVVLDLDNQGEVGLCRDFEMFF